MGKVAGLLILVTASLGAVYAEPWERLGDLGIAPLKLDTIAGHTPTRAGSVSSEGWQGLTRQVTPGSGDTSEPRQPAPTIVMIGPRASEPSVRAPSAALVNDRAALTREIQRELKRVGCYDGEVSGVWSPATRGAMKAFTGRANATLPVEGPDLILLSLVQGREDRVCGAGCPEGQGLALDGRCVPQALLAQPAKKVSPRPGATEQVGLPPVPAITGWSTTTTATPVPGADNPTPPEGRMALAGPAEGTAPTPPAVAPPASAPRQPPPAPRTGFNASFFKQVDRMGSN